MSHEEYWIHKEQKHKELIHRQRVKAHNPRKKAKVKSQLPKK